MDELKVISYKLSVLIDLKLVELGWISREEYERGLEENRKKMGIVVE